MANQIRHSFTAPDGLIFTSFDECWDYVRRRWYSNIKIFRGDGVKTWRISETDDAIVNNVEELNFLREGLEYHDNACVQMPYAKEVAPGTWISFEGGYDSPEFLIIPRSSYTVDKWDTEGRLKYYKSDCDLRKSLRAEGG